MDEEGRDRLAQELRRQRELLLMEVAETEAGLRVMAEARESELEERGQEERLAGLLARLDDRAIQAFQEIEAALQRMIDRTYGTCESCGQPIPLARLHALPATRLCAPCARVQEEASGAGAAEMMPRAVRVVADVSLLTDRELEALLREREERTPPAEASLPEGAPDNTEDVVESTEEGLAYVPTTGPPPEEA
jgi:RNA polymerase-binding protein DksA